MATQVFDNTKRGFTLLELIVVIIIIGVLGSLGFTQYTRVVERGRSGEAKLALGALRKAEEAYKLENSIYTAQINDLFVNPPTTCTSTHYFSYGVTSTVATARRCTASGKRPDSAVAYGITLTYVPTVWGGSVGYY